MEGGPASAAVAGRTVGQVPADLRARRAGSVGLSQGAPYARPRTAGRTPLRPRVRREERGGIGPHDAHAERLSAQTRRVAAQRLDRPHVGQAPAPGTVERLGRSILAGYPEVDEDA